MSGLRNRGSFFFLVTFVLVVYFLGHGTQATEQSESQTSSQQDKLPEVVQKEASILPVTKEAHGICDVPLQHEDSLADLSQLVPQKLQKHTAPPNLLIKSPVSSSRPPSLQQLNEQIFSPRLLRPTSYARASSPCIQCLPQQVFFSPIEEERDKRLHPNLPKLTLPVTPVFSPVKYSPAAAQNYPSLQSPFLPELFRPASYSSPAFSTVARDAINQPMIQSPEAGKLQRSFAQPLFRDETDIALGLEAGSNKSSATDERVLAPDCVVDSLDCLLRPPKILVSRPIFGCPMQSAVGSIPSFLPMPKPETDSSVSCMLRPNLDYASDKVWQSSKERYLEMIKVDAEELSRYFLETGLTTGYDLVKVTKNQNRNFSKVMSTYFQMLAQVVKKNITQKERESFLGCFKRKRSWQQLIIALGHEQEQKLINFLSALADLEADRIFKVTKAKQEFTTELQKTAALGLITNLKNQKKPWLDLQEAAQVAINNYLEGIFKIELAYFREKSLREQRCADEVQATLSRLPTGGEVLLAPDTAYITSLAGLTKTIERFLAERFDTHRISIVNRIVAMFEKNALNANDVKIEELVQDMYVELGDLYEKIGTWYLQQLDLLQMRYEHQKKEAELAFVAIAAGKEIINIDELVTVKKHCMSQSFILCQRKSENNKEKIQDITDRLQEATSAACQLYLEQYNSLSQELRDVAQLVCKSYAKQLLPTQINAVKLFMYQAIMLLSL
jgi:hypothetical protein